MKSKEEGFERRQLLKFAGLSTLAGLGGLGCGSSGEVSGFGIRPASAQTDEFGTAPTPNFLSFQRGKLGQVVDLGEGRFQITLSDVSLSLVIETLTGFSEVESPQAFVEAFQQRYSDTMALGSLYYRDVQGSGAIFAARLTSPTANGDSLSFVADALEALPGSLDPGDDVPTTTLASTAGFHSGEVNLVVQAREVQTTNDRSITITEMSETKTVTIRTFEGPEILDASFPYATIDFQGNAIFSVEMDPRPVFFPVEIADVIIEGDGLTDDGRDGNSLKSEFNLEGSVALNVPRFPISIQLAPSPFSGTRSTVVYFTSLQDRSVVKRIRVSL